MGEFGQENMPKFCAVLRYVHRLFVYTPNKVNGLLLCFVNRKLQTTEDGWGLGTFIHTYRQHVSHNTTQDAITHKDEHEHGGQNTTFNIKKNY